MRYSGSQLLGALLLPLIPLSAAAPAESARVPRHATIVDRASINSKYTFIIAGGGIAGLTLADRLTEDPKGTVQCFPGVYHLCFESANVPLQSLCW